MNRNRAPLRRVAAASTLAAAAPAAAQAPPTVTLEAPAARAYGKPLRLTGTVSPPAAQPVQVTVQPPGCGAPQPIASGTTRPDGTFAQLHPRAAAPGALGGSFGADTRDAVYAFQKIQRLARTGTVGTAVWNALARAHTPRASRRGTHIEVHKGRQVLLELHDGKVKHVVNTSTGLTGNTPPGRWRIYRKDAGFNSLGMLAALYFIGGYAVHGYHSVPPSRASHGCARIPLWAAHGVDSRWNVGDAVYVL